jgi:hypothetical protein
VLNDMVWLRQVFLHASAARGIDAPLQVLDRARLKLLRTRCPPTRPGFKRGRQDCLESK